MLKNHYKKYLSGGAAAKNLGDSPGKRTLLTI
jgi:hypothetical protein